MLVDVAGLIGASTRTSITRRRAPLPTPITCSCRPSSCRRCTTHDNLVLCYNVLLLGLLAASAFAMHLLVRALAGSETAAYVAGLIFGFAPYHFTQLPHIQLQALYCLPLSLLFLHRVFAAERGVDTAGLGLTVGLQTVSSIYYGIIGGIGVALVAATLAILNGRLRDWRLIRRGLAAAAIALVVLLPWSLPYLRVQREAGAGRTLSEAARGGAVLASYIQAPPSNLLYGRTGWLRPTPASLLPRKDSPEQDLFPGFCALLLAFVGAVAAPRGPRAVTIAYLVVAGFGIVLSLGPDGIRPLYSVMYNWVFGMGAIRATSRFSVLVLAAIAVRRGWARASSRVAEHGTNRDRTGAADHRAQVQQRCHGVSGAAAARLERRAMDS